jgi:hypothetical protein
MTRPKPKTPESIQKEAMKKRVRQKPLIENTYDGRPLTDEILPGDPLLEALRERGHGYAEDTEEPKS